MSVMEESEVIIDPPLLRTFCFADPHYLGEDHLANEVTRESHRVDINCPGKLSEFQFAGSFANGQENIADIEIELRMRAANKPTSG